MALAGAAFVLAAGFTSAPLAQFRGTADVTSVRALLSLDRLYPGTGARAAVILQIEPGWHVNAHEPGMDYLIATKLELTAPEGLELSPVLYPEPKVMAFEFAGTELPVYEGEVALYFEVTAAAGHAPGSRSIDATLSVQACNDRLCLAPARLPVSLEVEVTGLDVPVQPMHTEWFADGTLAPLEADDRNPSDAGGTIARLLEDEGWWITLGIIFVGGLALNLTPCVYPVIPITLAYFGAQASECSLPKWLLALLYVAGLAITYSSLGVIAALTGNILGVQLQNPWVLGAIAAVLITLALSFFGLYELRPPSALSARLGSRRGAGGALFMGLTIGLVAAPCVGPFVIPLLAFVGATGDPWQGFWMFLALALGMGAPYLFLAMGAASLNRLPRAGEWMVGVKRIFGLALLVLAVYFARTLLPKGIEPWLLPGALLLSALYLALFEHSADQVRAYQAVKVACAAIALGMAVWLGWPAPPGVQWQAYTPEAVQAARQAGQPVIIDFYADWCLPCKELDRFTFSDPRVIEAAESFVTLKVDLTQFSSPPVEALRRQYDVRAVPTILFLDTQGREPTHLRVTGYVRAEQFHDRMREILGGAPAPAATDLASGP
ncbi:MAG: cytochrome c biogenesis protein CcdA [Acidobacteriota bacterium]